MIRHLPILLSSEGLQYIVDSQRVKAILLMAIYMLSPVDILPEALLGPIGLVDDGAVLMTFLRELTMLLIGFVRDEGHRARAE